MPNKPLKFANAEACLRLTVIAMRLANQADQKFLAGSMQAYGDLRVREATSSLLEALQSLVAQVQDEHGDEWDLSEQLEAIAKATEKS